MAVVPAEVVVALAPNAPNRRMTLSAVAHALGRPTSSVQRALETMMQHGSVTARVDDGRPAYGLSDGAPLEALVEVARWSLPARRIREIERSAGGGS